MVGLDLTVNEIDFNGGCFLYTKRGKSRFV